MNIPNFERKLLLSAAAGVAFALQLGASCDVNNNYEERHVYHDSPPPTYTETTTVYPPSSPGYPPPPPPYVQPGYGQPYGGPPPVIVEQPPGYVEAPPVIVDDRPNRIPRWADQVRDGHGKQRWTADFDGIIYVYDAEKDYIPWTGGIHRGQEIVVRPDDDRITVDEHPVYQQNLRRDGRYEIFFEPTGRRQQYPDWDPHTHGHAAPIPPDRRPDPDRRQDPDRRSDSDHGGYAPHDDPRHAGTPVLPDELRDCTVMGRGDGDLVINAAPRDGTVLIFDEDDHRIVYRRDLGRGNSFQMFRGKGFVNVNSRRADNVDLRRDHHYSLYFRNK